MKKPEIFVGCSTEGLKVARALQEKLKDQAIIQIWDQGLFEPGDFVLETLLNSLAKFDYAILILRADDEMTVRNEKKVVSRDNVLFELGLFMGQLGRKKTIVLYDRHSKPKIISDLAGLTFATFDGENPDLSTALISACDQINQNIKDTFLTKKVLFNAFFNVDYKIVIGRFTEFELFEPSGFWGVGDAMGLSELTKHLDERRYNSFTVEYADKLNGELLSENLILIGGPDANQITGDVVSRLELSLGFGNPDNHEIGFYNRKNNEIYNPIIKNEKVVKDYGVIISAKNPYNTQNRVLLFFGSFGFGTWAALKYVTSDAFLRQEIGDDDDFECLIETDVIKDTPHGIKTLFINKLG